MHTPVHYFRFSSSTQSQNNGTKISTPDINDSSFAVHILEQSDFASAKRTNGPYYGMMDGAFTRMKSEIHVDVIPIRSDVCINNTRVSRYKTTYGIIRRFINIIHLPSVLIFGYVINCSVLHKLYAERYGRAED